MAWFSFQKFHAMNNIEQIDFKCIMVASTTDSTLSRLWMEKYSNQVATSQQGLCWILEDGQRSAKIDGRTCIPVGRYRVRPTRNSKFYEQYQKDPSLKLKYVLTLEEVPDFSLIRVHPGVKIGDTRGCPLPGLATDMDTDSNFTVARSREALKRIHRHLDAFFDEKGMDFRIPVWWEVVRKPLIIYF